VSTDHDLLLSWIRWRGRLPDRPGKSKRVLRVNWPLPMASLTLTVGRHCSCIVGDVGDMESEWAFVRASIVEAAVRSLLVAAVWRQPQNPLVDTSGEGSRQAEEGGLSDLVGPGVS